MYGNPVLLPEITNREDLLRTVSLFDDDTGLAFDLSGRTLAGVGDFTGHNWTVTDGLIITNSITPITIKDYPFGNEMQAIPFTIGLNLGILAGDQMTVSDPTGLNTLTGNVVSYVPSSGATVLQVGAAVDFEIRSHHHENWWCDYGSASGIGTDWSDTPQIQAQLGSGVTMIGLGIIQIRIPATTIQKLRHKTYSAAIVLYQGGDTRQLFIGRQPILYGGVSTQPLALAAASNPFGLP
jgi:hypothetical protein